jgi:hypothetical protein
MNGRRRAPDFTAEGCRALSHRTDDALQHVQYGTNVNSRRKAAGSVSALAATAAVVMTVMIASDCTPGPAALGVTVMALALSS